jgi:hypothetical protein
MAEEEFFLGTMPDEENGRRTTQASAGIVGCETLNSEHYRDQSCQISHLDREIDETAL